MAYSQQEVNQLTTDSPPIPHRTQRNVQSSNNVAATWNTNILIDIATTLPDKIIDFDAEHTITIIFVNVTNLIQQQFKEIACSCSLIGFLYMIVEKEPQDAFKKSYVIKQ